MKETAPAAKLIAHCGDLPPLAGLGATIVHGACRVPLPQLSLAVDISIDGHDLRARMETGSTTATSLTASAAGKELAGGAWQLAFWGHGTVLAPIPKPLPAGAIPPCQSSRCARS